MAKEEIILEFQVEQGAALTEMEKTKKAIVGLKEEQAELNKAYKQGNITMDEYAQESVRIEQTQKKLTRTYSDMTHQIQGTKRWTDELKGSMQQLAPQTANAVEGFKGMTKAALTFIATPIGAVIAALGAAIYALKAYFNSSEEAQDRFNKIVNIGKGIFERYMNVVEAFGEAIFNFVDAINAGDFAMNTFTKKFGALGVAVDIALAPLKLMIATVVKLGEALAWAFPETADNVKGYFDTLNKEAEMFAQTQSDIDKMERELLVKRAEVHKQVSELREKAIHQEGAAKRQTIEEAIALERGLSDEEVKLAQLRKDLAEAELQRNGDDKEAKKAVAEATAELINAEAQRYDATLRFEKQLEALDEQQQKVHENELKRKQELADFLLEQDSADLERQQEKFDAEFEMWSEQQDKLNERNEELKDVRIEMQADEAEQVEAINVQVSESRKKTAMQELAITEQLVAKGMERKKAELQAHKIVEANKLQLTENVLTGTMGLLKEHTIAYKAVATAKATIDTYQAASNALANAPNPIIGGIMAAIAIVMGLLNVAKINGVAMAGGGAFETKGPTWLLVGDNPGGRERVEVTPLSGKGQTRILGNGGGIAMAGGGSINGSILATASTSPMDQQFAMQETLANQPPIYVSWTEKTQFENQMANKAQFTEA